MISVTALSAADLARLYARPIGWPVLAWAGSIDGHVAALGGLSWRFGRCDIWLEVWDGDAVPARAIVIWARRMLQTAKQMGEPAVYCFRDDHPNSAKLLGLIGLELDHIEDVGFDDGSGAVREVWGKWLHSRLLPRSQPSEAP
jgi:hypothetical protein